MPDESTADSGALNRARRGFLLEFFGGQLLLGDDRLPHAVAGRSKLSPLGGLDRATGEPAFLRYRPVEAPGTGGVIGLKASQLQETAL